MGVVLTSGYRYRHVVFTAAARRRPLNLGAPGLATSTRSPRPAVAQAPQAPAEADGRPDEDAFLAWLFAQGGLKARDYRPTSLRRRLPACLRALRAENLSHARRLLRRHAHLIPAAMDALLLGVTEFFRDAPVFDHLDAELATMAAAGTWAAGARPLRVWSAGCSDGAELYSVGMLLAKHDVLHRCELLGTDCRPDAVTRAAAGAFAGSALRGVWGLPGALLDRCFEGDALDGRVSPEVRARVTWRVGDVLTRMEPGPWDVILCRNLAMYLHAAAAERLWRNLAASVRPGGLLVLGKAERPGGAAGLAQVGPCVYRRYGEP